jgi:serine/threonine-protein kinase
LLGTRLDGRFQLEAIIATGGMGTVYLAQDTRLNRLVAVKLLPITGDHIVRERFAREAGVLARLSHRNINAIYDAGEHEGRPFLILEYVEGRALSEYARADYDVLLDLLVQALRALAYAHGRGVVHRDLKPANLFVCQADAGEQSNLHLKVLDFGVAALAKSTRITSDRHVTGTPTYLSPEQATGGNVDGRSDLYSLGVVWYELITGQPPFHGDSAVSTIFQHVNVPPASPRLARVDLPESLERFILTLLAKDPGLRFASAEQALNALDLVRQDPAVRGAIERAKQERQNTKTAQASRRAQGSKRAASVLSAFVGRQAEMGVLTQTLEAAATGKPQLVVVEGPAGIGKSRLFGEFANFAKHREADVRFVRATEPADSVRYSGLAALFGDQRQPDTANPTLPAPIEVTGRHGELQWIASLTSPKGSEAAVPSPLVAGLVSKARAIAHVGVLVLLVDDAEFLDASSVHFLRQLLYYAAASQDHGEPLKLLLALAARREALPRSPVGRLLQVERSVQTQRISLSGLEDRDLQDALTRAAREAPSPRITEQIADLAGGSPRRLAEIVRALTDCGQLTWDERGWGMAADEAFPLAATPHDVAQALVARMDDGAINLLAPASVLGLTFDSATLEELWAPDEAPDPALQSALAEAAQLGILDVIEAATRGSATEPVDYAFASDLYRDVLYECLGATRRRAFHLAAASILAQREDHDDRANEIARHFRVAGDEAQASDWALAAARKEFGQNKREQAIASVRLALQSAEAEVPQSERLYRLRMHLAELLRGQGDYNSAVEEYERTLAWSEETNSRDVTQRVLQELAATASAARRPTLIEHYARRAIASSWANGDDAMLGNAMSSLAFAQVLTGNWAEAMSSLDQASWLDDTDDDATVRIRGVRLYARGLACRQSGNLLASLSHMLIAWVEGAGDGLLTTPASMVVELARALVAAGNAGEALKRIASAFATRPECRSLADDALLYLAASEVYAASHSWSIAEELAKVAVRMSTEPDAQCASYLVLTQCARACGRLNDATTAIEAAQSCAAELGLFWYDTGALQVRIAETWADLGMREASEGAVQRARRFAERHDQRGLLALVRRTEARLLDLAGDFESASNAAHVAHAELNTLGELVEAIETRIIVAHICGRRDDPHAHTLLVSELDQAAGEADALGVEPLRQRIVDEFAAANEAFHGISQDATTDSYRALRGLVGGLLALREHDVWLAVQTLGLATTQSAASGGCLSAMCHLSLAEALLNLDPPRRSDAERHLKDARFLYTSAGIQDGVQEVDTWLRRAGSHALSGGSTSTR